MTRKSPLSNEWSSFYSFLCVLVPALGAGLFSHLRQFLEQMGRKVLPSGPDVSAVRPGKYESRKLEPQGFKKGMLLLSR